MTVMNVQSSSKGLDDLLFYIVPANWYRRAWRSLLRPQTNIPLDWREQIGDLPAVKPWFHGEQENGDKLVQQKADVLKEIKSVWKQPVSATEKRLTKVHEKDYYFVGQNTWGVLENKFGKNASADGVACHVVSFPQEDSRLAVNLPDGQRISIPGSGRFAYEQSLAKEDQDENVTEGTVSWRGET